MTPRRFVIAHLAATIAVAVASFAPTAYAQQSDRRAALAAIDEAIGAARYADAEREARAQLAAAESAHGVDSPLAADFRDRLVSALWRQEKPTDELRRLARQALAARERLSPDRPELADALINFANTLELEGRSTEARPYYERAVSVAERALGPDHPQVATALLNLGVLLKTLGEFGPSRDALQRAVRIRERAFGADHDQTGRVWHNLAATLWESGEYEQARDAFARAGTVFERAHGPDHPFVAAAAEGHAAVSLALGDYTTAESQHRRALGIRERVLGPDHPLVGGSLANLGDTLATMGDLTAALPLLERSLKIYRTTYGDAHQVLTVPLTNLAHVRVRLGDVKGARLALDEGIAIREKAFGTDHASLDIPLRELANLLADHVAAADAWPVYERARRIATQSRGADHPAVAAIDIEEGGRRTRERDYPRARLLLERAAAVTGEALGEDHPETAAARHALAELRARTGDSKEALSLALKAENAAREHFRVTAQSLPERQALLFAEARTRSQNLALSLVASTDPPERLEPVWDAVVRARSLVLDEMAARTRLQASEDPETQGLTTELRKVRERLARRLLSADADPTREAAEAINKLQAERERLERDLARRSLAFRRAQTQQAAGLADVAKAMPSGTALVAFVQYADTSGSTRKDTDAQIAAFVRTAAGRVAFARLGAASRIARLIGAWRASIREEAQAPPVGAAARETAYREAAARVRAAIWEPLSAHLSSARRVFIVPDGPINLLDFAALPIGRRSYLIERGPALHYLSAERDLVRAPTQTASSGLLAIGDPAFHARTQPSAPAARRNLRSSCRVTTPRFEPLPESAREINEIEQTWRRFGRGRAVLLTGRDATETAVKNARGWSVLHVATHGLSLRDECGAVRPATTFDPGFALVRSGLILAGAAARSHAAEDGDDGILTGEEIASLDLDGVEWAVLSACDTGTGEVRPGEGVFGLRRAFHVAGAETVIMSLWQVDDALTRAWMQQLYRGRLQHGLSAPDAVRQAGRMLLRGRRSSGATTHPFYWSGFVAAGAWR